MVKNPLANAGDLRDAGSIPVWGNPLEAGTATHSSILDCSLAGATVHRVTESDRTEVT